MIEYVCKITVDTELLMSTISSPQDSMEADIKAAINQVMAEYGVTCTSVTEKG